MRFACVCVLTIVFSLNASSQQYPNLDSVLISSITSLNPTDGFYTYHYSLLNPISNSGSIISFQIDISMNEGSTQLDTIGLQFKNEFIEGMFRRHYPGLVGRIVPVGFSNTPGIWDGGTSNALTAVFWGDSRQLVLPGDTLSGFVVMSKGLPAIRLFTVSPKFDVDSLFPDLEDTARVLTIAQMDSIRDAVKFRGYTIGPSAPSAIFNGLHFLDTIASYITESRTLGWIANDQTKNKYTRLIDSAKANLSSSPARRGTAKATLDSVLMNVYPDSAAALITSEAYALLRFNTEYVMKKLRCR